MAAHKVLIVDDEFAIRDMLRMALELSDFECLEAENIQQAHARGLGDKNWRGPGLRQVQTG